MDKKHEDLSISMDLSEASAEDAIERLQEMLKEDDIKNFGYCMTLEASLLGFKHAVAVAAFCHEHIREVRLNKHMKPDEWRLVCYGWDNQIEYSVGSPGA